MVRIKKKEITNKIEEYAKKADLEMTPSLVRKYLVDVIGLSKSSAYRFFSKGEDDYIYIERKTPQRRENFEYSDEEFGEITEKAFEILHMNGKNSDTPITREEVIFIARKCNIKPEFLAYNILGIDTKHYDDLMSGKYKTLKISLGLGFKDDEISKKVRVLRNYCIKNYIGKKFTQAEIEQMAEEFELPIQIIIKKVFNASASNIQYLKKYGVLRFNTRREFIDYPYNNELDEEKRKNLYNSPFEQVNTNQTLSIFTEDDRKDSILEDEIFYEINATTKEQFIENLNNKRKILKKKREYLISKYDEKYNELLEIIKDLELQKGPDGKYLPNSKTILDDYISQLKEIITRNPKYYQYVPLCLEYNDFLKISEDFKISKEYLAYQMFGITPYNIRERKEKTAESGKRSFLK